MLRLCSVLRGTLLLLTVFICFEWLSLSKVVSPSLTDNIDLIHKILEKLPVRDAAKTCRLSKFWENIWSTLPYIDLDKQFYYDSIIEGNEENEISLFQYSTAVGMVLASHVGPIFTFKLYIPTDLQPEFIHMWTKIVCRNGVKVLELENDTEVDDRDEYPNTPYSVYECSSLETLVLRKFLLDQPPLLKPDSSKLKTVTLIQTTIDGNVSLGDGLTYLCLRACTGVTNLEYQFRAGNKLEHLVLHNNYEHDWNWLGNCEELHELLLWLSQNCKVSRRVSASSVLGNMQKLHNLRINGLSFKFLDATQPIFTRLTTIKILTLDSVNCYDSDEISKVLSLIRSSPELKKLSIFLLAPGRSAKSDPDKLGRHYRELGDTSLDQLYTVMIIGVFGTSADLDLIKFLLASSPGLRRMLICRHPNAEMNNIYRRVTNFHKASASVLFDWRQPRA